MGNMSYCRFENTERDFDDCKLTLEGMICEPEEYGHLSSRELTAAKRLMLSAIDLLQLLAESAGVEVETFFESRNIHQHEVETILDDLNETVKAAKNNDWEDDDE